MKKILFPLIVVLFLSGCAILQTPKKTNVAVSSLLDEIQVAIDEINRRTEETSLPPFKSAEVKLSTKAEKTTEGSAALVLSGEGSKTTSDSNIITLELVPNQKTVKSLSKSTGHEIAEYVIAAVNAVNEKNFLKLNTLTVEAGLEVREKAGGGIDVELVGISVKGKHSGETTTGNNLKLIFAYPNENN